MKYNSHLFKLSLFITCSLAGFAINQSSFAALVTTDLVTGSGDSLLTRDNATGLDWLNLGQTLGLSYANIEAGAGSWKAKGFRYATYGEVRALYQTNGVPGFANTASVTDVKLLLDLMGMTTFGYGGGGVLWDGTIIPYRLSWANADAYLDGGMGNVGLGHITWQLNDPNTWPIDNSAYVGGYINNAGYNLNPASSTIANYLVRPQSIPLPAAIWLLGSGLLSLIGLHAQNARTGLACSITK